MIKPKETGITLIALVITIIVLLILAAVSIAMLTGENGVLSQGKEAKKATEIAEAKERAQLDIMNWQAKQMENNQSAELNDEIIKNILTNLKNENHGDYIREIKNNSFITSKGNYEILYYELYTKNPKKEKLEPGERAEETKKDNYSDGSNTATIPGGFTVSKIEGEKTIDGGLVIYNIPKGVVPNWTEDTNQDGIPDIQTTYNQFVWIPVKDANSYQRDFTYPTYYNGKEGENTPQNSTFTDTGYLPKEIQPQEDNAIANENAERESILKYNGFYIGRYEAGEEENKVVSKQASKIWSNITQTNAKATAKTMYDSNTVKSALCSGIQWDMVMKFVDNKKDATGSTFNVRVVEEKRHTGNVVEAGKNNYDKVQNIYDLESNYREFVAEKNNISNENHEGFVCITRGGCHFKNNYERASERINYPDAKNENCSFRCTLYIM